MGHERRFKYFKPLTIIFNSELLKIIKTIISDMPARNIDLGFIVILTVVFFVLMPVLTFDSMWYHVYLDIFNATKPFTEWDPTRGIVFPLLIYISTKIFGYTTQGITIMMYLFYLLTLLFVFKFTRIVGIEISRIWIWIILSITLFLNPVFIGYYHLVLTEFVASTLVMIYLYLLYESHKSIEMMSKNQLRKAHITRAVQVICFAVILYYVKQMFAAPIVLLYLSSELLLIIRKFKISRLLNALGIGIIIITIIVLLNTVWHKVIDIDNATNILGVPASEQSFLTHVIMGGARYFQPDYKTKIIKGDVYSVTVNIIDNKNIINSFTYSGRKNSLSNSVKFVATCFIKDPMRLLTGYIDNYLVISNIYRFEGGAAWDGPSNHSIEKKISLIYAYENNVHGMHNQYVVMGTQVYSGFFETITPITNSDQYRQLFDTSLISKVLHNRLFMYFSNFLYSTIALLALPIAIISFIAVIRKREYFYLHSILFIMSFTIFAYIGVLAFMGACLDRYVFPLYTLCVFIIIISLKLIFKTVVSLMTAK